MIRTIPAAFVLLLMVGCSATAEQERNNALKIMHNSLVYTQDTQTGVCFAMITYPSDESRSGVSLAEVECDKAKKSKNFVLPVTNASS